MMKLKYGAAFCAAAAALLCSGTASASSHREAPNVTGSPKVDGTDLYMFRSYEQGRSGYVTVIADYDPAQEPGSGPNYYELDPDALYEIHFDTDGSGKPGLSFAFKFSNLNRDVGFGINGSAPQSLPLVNDGPISDVADPHLNVLEVYNLSVYRGGFANRATAGTITNKANGQAYFVKPVDYIGAKSLPDYETYARKHIYNIAIPGCADGRVFVGQRKDPFAVNLGEIFDLANVRVLGPMDQGKDALKNSNVTSFVLEVPIACLGGVKGVVGAWTTSSMKRSRVGDRPFLNAEEKAGSSPDDWIQVSRLANPLVNELVIGLKDKDTFNSSYPADDAQFLHYVTTPTFPALVALLFKSSGVVAPPTPRNDLVEVFLTGIPKVTANGATAEEMRLNTTIPPTPRGSQSNLGVIGGDNAGYPNGRRPGDDAVDITLRVAMGKLLDPKVAPSGQLPLVDGAYVDSTHFDEVFPYVRTPIANSTAIEPVQ